MKKKLSRPTGEAKQKPKTRPPTERERKKGQIVLDFINAETTDEACFNHFENVQELMDFSTDFAERLKEVYPLQVFKYLFFHSLYVFCYHVATKKMVGNRSSVSRPGTPMSEWVPSAVSNPHGCRCFCRCMLNWT